MYYGMLESPIVIILVFGTFIWAMLTQFQVKGAFKKYTRVGTQRGLTGHDAARLILDANGLRGVRIEHAHGVLSDHYDPKAGVVRLSPEVYGANSVASVAIAAHEVGHAIQHEEQYGFIAIRNALLPAAVASSKYVMLLFFAGMILPRILGYSTLFIGSLMMDIAILLFLGSVLFQAVTLPLEFDASNRAKAQLYDLGIVTSDEMPGVKKMLSAAAMTYVAALAVALAQLIRLIAIRGNRD